jgi:hypothetical protein
MATTRTTKTVAEVLDEFLADVKPGQSARTHAKYRTIVQLFRSYMESYWPGHDGEYSRITEAGGTFCNTFGPEEILGGYGEFLGYFMPRKVMCGKDTMQAAGTVTKKLAKWLTANGYVSDAEGAAAAEERAGAAAKDLPSAQKVLDLLDAYIDQNPPPESDDTIEDHFWIERIEPGRIWLSPLTAGHSLIGPVPAPQQATRLCKPMWDIGGVVAKTGSRWHFVEVWNVTP